MAILREYHAELGGLILAHEGTWSASPATG